MAEAPVDHYDPSPTAPLAGTRPSGEPLGPRIAPAVEAAQAATIPRAEDEDDALDRLVAVPARYGVLYAFPRVGRCLQKAVSIDALRARERS